MHAFIRSHRRFLRNDLKFYTTNNYNKFSTTHYRSHLVQKYRLNLNHYTPAISHGLSVATSSLDSAPRWATGEAMHIYNYNSRRGLQLSRRLCEQPSSKVEVTVNDIKSKQKEKEEEIKKEATSAAAAMAAAQLPDAPKAMAVKKPLKTRIWEEVLHYYHGFRLLFIDINICRKLLWRVLNGKTLTRRENKLLVRTTSDLFRLIPFSVFIIVPFMEILLPVFIKFFPGMLPSTFQTAKEREDKLKQSLQMRLEMAKFLQKTLDEMAVVHKDHKSEEAKQFAVFFHKIKDPNEYVSNSEIIKYAKQFEDEITLDSLSREQLVALCRVLEQNTMGTTNFLRFQLRMKLRSLAADDHVIAREGVLALDLFELQQACKARGMRAYGLSVERLRSQLQEWIDLSLNAKVPPTLLLLSRALSIADSGTTTDMLKETIRVLPDSVAAQTKAAIGEREGKIDNKTKIEVIKEEERKIKEELEEEREEEKAKAEVLLDKTPQIEAPETIVLEATAASSTQARDAPATKPKVEPVVTEPPPSDSISSKDVGLLTDALKSLSSDKKKMLVEKEALKDLKEELRDYKEDIDELREVRTEVQEPVRESRAAKLLFKKVNTMIDQLDKVLHDLEKKQAQIQEDLPKEAELTPVEAAIKRRQDDLVRIDELVNSIKQFKETSSESRLKTIETVLSKIDADKDGIITVDEVLKVVEAIGRENVHLNEKQLDELVALLDKEQIIEAEDRIEKAIARSIKEANQMKEAMKQEELQRKAKEVAEELKDTAPELKDNALNLDLADEQNILPTETKPSTSTSDASLLEAAEKQKEKIIPKADISSAIPPTIPPPTETSNKVNPKDKML